MEELYNSAPDTLAHIALVRKYLERAALELVERGLAHDASKLLPPEKEYFDRETPKLASLVYGSKEYSNGIKALKPALEHHFANNRHHAQYFGEKGMKGMNLFDILEMLMDWKASGERGGGGNIYKSIEINRTRKNINLSDDVAEILINTAEYLGWERPDNVTP